MPDDSYSDIKGRAAAPAAYSFHEAKPPRRSHALTDSELSVIADRKRMVEAHLPDALPFIRELFELGMIQGWRAVSDVEVFPHEHPAQPADPQHSTEQDEESGH